MTTETVVTKLMWILGQTKDVRKVRELFYRQINHDVISSFMEDGLEGIFAL